MKIFVSVLVVLGALTACAQSHNIQKRSFLGGGLEGGLKGLIQSKLNLLGVGGSHGHSGGHVATRGYSAGGYGGGGYGSGGYSGGYSSGGAAHKVIVVKVEDASAGGYHHEGGYGGGYGHVHDGGYGGGYGHVHDGGHGANYGVSSYGSGYGAPHAGVAAVAPAVKLIKVVHQSSGGSYGGGYAGAYGSGGYRADNAGSSW